MSTRKETRRYSKQDDLKDVERWCTMYPWYRRLIDDIHETLALRSARRDKRSGDYSVAKSGRVNRMNAA